MLEYSLKFTKLSRHAASLVSNPTDEMKSSVTCVSDDLKEKCRSDMLLENMDIFCNACKMT